MPASLFTDMDHHGGGVEEQRALQLALELSLLGLTADNDISAIGNGFDVEVRNKKSQNTTECVPVPSSEHVAEIVGRQGCKIKALRAKTNTYIKTPVRGEEPVFVVTGKKEDVAAAKKEILSAAEHFSQIRAQRKNNMNGSLVPGPNSNLPGQETIQVRVPYRVVGLVVGPKGATIKRIQQQTNTYIVTPGRYKEPVFEVTGMPDNVENARKEIEAHIAMVTGGMLDSQDLKDICVNDVDYSFTVNMNAANGFINSVSELNSGFTYDSNNILSEHFPDLYSFTPPSSNESVKLTDIYSHSVFANGFTNNFGFYDTDESHNYDSVVTISSSTAWSEFDTSPDTLFSTAASTSTSTTFSNLNHCSDPATIQSCEDASRIHTDAMNGSISSFPSLSNGTSVGTNEILINSFPTNSSGSSDSNASSPTEGRKIKRDCVVCYESEVVAALVPCGHNMFCLECANRICEKPGSECPVCRQLASQAIRIYS
ncbi:RNA-binding protein MEX3B-like isoform X2 [Centruroides sculpturatus]|uniref:RNA-binding protein MEX3B-like isoform X1 n=1 Tax=Centruroides sculpturatus TaxID=218467 RepID=UPI000C6DEC9C|nr:RNA-binding protein MEX3B-like isoform X1 [Centruroides sculpturatus]XP_023229004.1 RNA-binding protein MEX3B-like isoform X2 [Centruroides sculpturatus]